MRYMLEQSPDGTIRFHCDSEEDLLCGYRLLRGAVAKSGADRRESVVERKEAPKAAEGVRRRIRARADRDARREVSRVLQALLAVGPRGIPSARIAQEVLGLKSGRALGGFIPKIDAVLESIGMSRSDAIQIGKGTGEEGRIALWSSTTGTSEALRRLEEEYHGKGGGAS